MTSDLSMREMEREKERKGEREGERGRDTECEDSKCLMEAMHTTWDLKYNTHSRNTHTHTRIIAFIELYTNEKSLITK